MRLKKALLALPIGAIIFSSCGVSQQDIVSLQREILKVKKEVVKLKKRQVSLKKGLESLSNRVDNVSQMASENSLEIEKLKMKKSNVSTTTGGGGYTPSSQQAPQQAEVPTNKSDVDIYREALEYYQRQDFENARRLLDQIIENFPYSKYYDNALFWKGQTYYREGKYEEAIQYFDKLINECETGKAPDCNKLPMAMLKKAFSLVNLGDIENAKKVLQTIIKEFPESEAYELAVRKLQSLE